ncbi:MAG: leucine-rich repeat protein [Lachnospiraceae bacterium]|nr:leucine-rich repeat protein [Lachnospiraceae bacterium]
MLKKMQKRVCAVLALALILGMSFAGQKAHAKDIAKGYSAEKIKEEPVAESGKDSMPLPESNHDTESAKDKVTQTYQWDEVTGTLTVNEREGAIDWLNEGDNYLKTQDVKRLEFKSKEVMREAGGAFTNVEEIILHEGVEVIEAQAFLGTKIKNLIFPPTVKKIEDEIFRQVNELESIEFKGEEVPEINEGIFGYSTTNKLEIKINVPKASENTYKQRIFQTIGVEEIEFNGKLEQREKILEKEQPEEKVELKPEEKVELKPEEKAELKLEEKAEPKLEEKAESKPEEKVESKPDSSQPGSGSSTEEEKPDNIQEGSGSNTEGENSDITQGGSNSQSKPEIETPSDKENTSGMITNSPMAEGNRAVGTETGYYPQDRKEEQVPKISYATTSSVAGQKSTVSGVFILNKGINVAVRTPQEQLKADFLLETNERLFAKILDMDLKKSNLAKASLDSIMTSVGGKPIAYLNIEMGTMKNGVYKGITESDKTISYAVEISPKDNLEKFDVIRVREGGKLDILKSQYSKGVITFETTPALGAYLIISY